MNPCDISNYLATDRHCDVTDGQNGDIYFNDKSNTDPLCMVHAQIWDSTHFYTAHLFDLGMRERARDKNQDSKDNDDEYDGDDEWNITDHEMNRRWKRIQHKRNQIPRVYNARFKSESNKFIIKHVTDSNVLSSSTSKSYSEELGNYLIVKWNESESISIPTGPTSSNTDIEIDDMMQCLVQENKVNDQEITEFIKFGGYFHGC